MSETRSHKKEEGEKKENDSFFTEFKSFDEVP